MSSVQQCLLRRRLKALDQRGATHVNLVNPLHLVFEVAITSNMALLQTPASATPVAGASVVTARYCRPLTLLKQGTGTSEAYCAAIAQTGTFCCFCSGQVFLIRNLVSELPRGTTDAFLSAFKKQHTRFESRYGGWADTANGLTVFRESEIMVVTEAPR